MSVKKLEEKIVTMAHKFSDDALEIALVLNGTFLRQFMLGQNKERFNKDTIFHTKDLNLKECEIHRSLVCDNSDVLFSLDIDFHDDNILDGLNKAMLVARKVENIFPGQFLWAFSGRNIHGHSYIRYNKDTERHIVRYGKVFDFCKAIVYYLKDKHYINAGDTAPYHYKGLIKSMGSYHRKTGLYKIPITLDMEPHEIFKRAETLDVSMDWTIPEMDVELFRQHVPVYEIAGKTHEGVRHDDTKKRPVNMSEYPDCIKKIMALPKKGNKVRFDLLRYFFYLHKKSDALYLMKTILTDAEYKHMMKEKSFEVVYTRGYPPPTNAHIKRTYNLVCDRPNATLLDWKKK